jgi:hypothetical protein
MATEKDVDRSLTAIYKEVERVGAWVEETKKQIRAGKVTYIEVKITFKVT